MIITDKIEIPESEIKETFIRSSGPGGQNVNKVASAAQLRFNVLNSESLPDYVRARIIHTHHNRMNKDGDLVINSAQYRTQSQNREKVREKLKSIIISALKRKKKRVKTKPSYRARQARLDRKKRISQKKSDRQKKFLE